MSWYQFSKYFVLFCVQSFTLSEKKVRLKQRVTDELQEQTELITSPMVKSSRGSLVHNGHLYVLGKHNEQVGLKVSSASDLGRK